MSASCFLLCGGAAESSAYCNNGVPFFFFCWCHHHFISSPLFLLLCLFIVLSLFCVLRCVRLLLLLLKTTVCVCVYYCSSCSFLVGVVFFFAFHCYLRTQYIQYYSCSIIIMLFSPLWSALHRTNCRYTAHCHNIILCHSVPLLLLHMLMMTSFIYIYILCCHHVTVSLLLCYHAPMRCSRNSDTPLFSYSHRTIKYCCTHNNIIIYRQ